MAVCRMILGKRFRRSHYIGVIICLTGGLLTLWTDWKQSGNGDAIVESDAYFGDICASLAAVLYGVADSAGEFWTKQVDRREYLGMIGLHGAIFSFFAFVFAEHKIFFSLINTQILGLEAFCVMFWYTLSLASFYVLASLFLEFSDATLLTLSLQASNIWAVLFSIAAFQLVPPLPVFVAGILIAVGVSVYEILGNGNESSSDDCGLHSSPSSENSSFDDDSSADNSASK